MLLMPVKAVQYNYDYTEYNEQMKYIITHISLLLN